MPNFYQWIERLALSTLVQVTRIENGIEWDLGPIRIAAFTGLNQLLGFAQGHAVDEEYVLLFRGWVEKSREALVVLMRFSNDHA